MPPRLTSVETFVARYPVTGRFRYLQGRDGKPPTRDTVVVRVADDAGGVGWGQSVPSPTWSYETLDTVRTTIDRHLGPALIGIDPGDAEAVARVLDRVIAPSFSTGQPIAKAGIDLALFDLNGRRADRTAAQVWGRAGRREVTLSWTVDATTPAEAEATVAEARSRGFRNFNLKAGRDATADVAVAAEVRRLAPEAFIWADANGGYDVATASDGEEALALFQTVQPDVVVLDVMMPKMDGYGVIQALRQQSEVPIVMLSACSEVKDRILGLELGADDYITKPFSPKELEARIRCVLRRTVSGTGPEAAGSAPREIKIGQLMILPHKRQVFKAGERVKLTGMEFDLLEMLMAHSGQPLTRQEMLSKIWGYTPERHVDTRVVDVHISRLRSKLEDDPANPELILTARGTGYLFQRIVDAVAPEAL